MINENLSLWYQSWYEEQANKGKANKISYYYLEDYCSEIKLNMSIDKIAGTLTFKIPYGIYSPSIFPINIRKGDKVSLTYKKLILFTGKVITVNKNSNQEMEVTCYDYCWFLCKSKISKNFSNITVYDAIKWVYNNVGMYFNAERFKSELGENANIMLDTHLIEEKEANKVLSAIYTDVRNKTGLSYYMHTAGYSSTQDVIITETDRYYSGLTLEYSSKDKADGNVIDWSISESMENMITQYRVYGENAEPVRVDRGNNDTSFSEDDSNAEKETSNIIRLNDGDYLHYGVIQDIITMQDGDDIEKVRQKALNNMTKNNGEPILNVTCFGDLDYCPAFGIHVKIPCTEFYDKFAYINTSEWVWNQDGSFISKLECKLSKHTDMTEWDDIETKDTSKDDTTGEGSGSVENAVQWMIAIANDDTHGYSQANRWGTPDYDCSSFVITGFEQAGIPLKTNGATYTGNMKAAALKCGFELVNWNNDINNLKRGDILLNEASHVACYIGGGKIVHASSDRGNPQSGDQTGTEIYIANYYNKPWNCVLRYQSSDTSAGNGGLKGLVSNKLIELLKKEEGFVKSWDNSSSYGAIGYGTDASGNLGEKLKKQGVTSCTEEQATGWLIEEANEWAKQIKNYIKSQGISLQQNYFDCCVDIAYQWGNRKWKDVANLLGKNDINGAKNYIMSMGSYTIRNKSRCNILDGTYTYAG